MEKRGEKETSEPTQTTGCAEENPKRETERRGQRNRLVVSTWNVRTLAVKRKNGLGHAETLLLRDKRLDATSSDCRR